MKEVEPNLVWGPAVGKAAVPKLFCGVEECKPWTKSEDLPGRSYKSSNKISHPPLHASFEFVETKPIKLAEETMLRDFRYKKMQYTTSYGKAYTYKFNPKGLTDTPNVPHAIGFNLTYQWMDKVKNFPPGKLQSRLSEMKDRFKFSKDTSKCAGVLNDIRSKVICNIYAPGREALEKTDANINCIQKIMDPYISTTQYNHVYFDPVDIRKYKHVEARPVHIFEKKPVYDESFLGPRFLDRFIRKKIPIVPHRGMLSETHENYKQPLDELAHKHLQIYSLLKLKRLTKGEVMSVPGMYHTDYDHIGHNWPLSTVV